jgi:hypothetical protein
MKIRMAYLVQAVFALIVAGALSFGASHAFANEGAALLTCPATGSPYEYAPCGKGCPFFRGHCDETGTCRCGEIP